MSKISKKTHEKPLKTNGVGIDHQKYISRITKTLYYSKLPKTDQLSLPVTELAAELFSEAQQGKSLNRLHCDEAARISRNACVSPCSLVLALLYLEKLKTCDPEYLERTAPSDLFLVSLMVSCKFLYDDGETDEVFIDEWATSAGISTKQLVFLEKNFLKAINWEIFVNDLKFWKKLHEIEQQIAKKEGCNRGYFTYTELENLLDLIELNNLIQCIVAVSTILAATYTAGLLTIVGAIFLTSQIPGTCIYQQKTILDSPQTLIPLEISNKTDCALKILNTGIILASINLTNDLINNENKTQQVSWDWWTVPSMKWLSESSDYHVDDKLNIVVDYLGYFIETSSVNMKYLNLGDHIQKATKTRIQNQLETKWHKEWTDSIKTGWFPNQIHL